jgi:hypothetical protein
LHFHADRLTRFSSPIARSSYGDSVWTKIPKIKGVMKRKRREEIAREEEERKERIACERKEIGPQLHQVQREPPSSLERIQKLVKICPGACLLWLVMGIFLYTLHLPTRRLWVVRYLVEGADADQKQTNKKGTKNTTE